MNKLLFDAHVLSLYAQDYEYMQDSAENYTNTLFRQLIKNPNVTAIIQGFDLQLDTGNKLKVVVDSSTGLSSLVTESGVIVETSSDFTQLALAASTGDNFVYAHYLPIKGSYNTSTGTNIDGEKNAIDLSTYELNYNRQRDNAEILVLTTAEKAAITDLSDYIYLGKSTATGGVPGPISKTNVITAIMNVFDGSIEVSNLASDFMLPQTMINPTSNCYVCDSLYARCYSCGSTCNLQYDLNIIRSEIRDIKGTLTWCEETQESLINMDSSINCLHENGVIPWSCCHGNSCIITSSGSYYIHITDGKSLINGSIAAIPSGGTCNLLLSSVPKYKRSADGIPAAVEAHNDICTGCSIPFNYNVTYCAQIDNTCNPSCCNKACNIHVYQGSSCFCVTVDCYCAGFSNFCYCSACSTLHNCTLDGSYCIDYNYGYNVIQSVDAIDDSTYCITQGYCCTYPAKPAAVATNALRLYNIVTHPFGTTAADADICDARTYITPIREVIDIHYNCTSVIAYTPNKLSYYDSTGDTGCWTCASGYYCISSNNACATTSILAKANDELYLRITKPYNISDQCIAVTIDSNPGVSYAINQLSGVDSDNMLMSVGTVATSGYHNVKIATVGTCPFKLWGIVYGRLDNCYNRDNIHAGNFCVSSTGLVGIGVTNPSYSLDINNPSRTRGINILNTSASSTNYGVYVTACGAATANYGVYSYVCSGTTKYGIVSSVVGSGTCNTGLCVSASGGTCNIAITIAGPTVSGLCNYAICSTATAPSYFAGKVGLGITNPSSCLVIDQNNSYSNACGFSLKNTTAPSTWTAFELYVCDLNKVLLQTASQNNYTDANLLLQSAGGNVGIGTSVPNYPLEVLRNSFGLISRFATNTDRLSYIQVGSTTQCINLGIEDSLYSGNLASGSIYRAAVLSNVSNYPLQFATNNTVRTTILADGKVGIGTTAPSYKLDVLTSTPNDRGINILNNASTGANYGICSTVSGVATTNYGIYSCVSAGTTKYGMSINVTGAGTSTNNYGLSILASGGCCNTALEIGGPASGVNCYAIYSSATAYSYFAGSVGIGTTNPGTLFEVSELICFNYDNVIVGCCAHGLAGSYNTILGARTGYSLVGSYSVAIGYHALCCTTSGGSNVAIGVGSLRSNITSCDNTAVGSTSGCATTGCCNTYLGNHSGCTVTTGNCNIIIGAGAGASVTTHDDTIVIGSSFAGGAYSGTTYIKNISGVARCADSGEVAGSAVYVSCTGQLYTI